MALHPTSPNRPTPSSTGGALVPADEALREASSEKLMPPLVAQLRKKVKEWRDSGYVGAADTSRKPCSTGGSQPAPAAPGRRHDGRFHYYFAQREALEKQSSISTTR